MRVNLVCKAVSQMINWFKFQGQTDRWKFELLYYDKTPKVHPSQRVEKTNFDNSSCSIIHGPQMILKTSAD